AVGPGEHTTAGARQPHHGGPPQRGADRQPPALVPRAHVPGVAGADPRLGGGAVVAAAGGLLMGAAVATCPLDRWTFTPVYTDGECPLCGWQPPGIDATAPWFARIDW